MFPRAWFHSLTENKSLKSEGWEGSEWGQEGINWFPCSCFVKMSLEINYKVRWLWGNPLPDKSPLCFSRLEEAGTLLMGTQATGLGPPWRQTLSSHQWGEARRSTPINPTRLCQGWGWPATTPDHSPAQGHEAGCRPRDISYGQRHQWHRSSPRRASHTNLKPRKYEAKHKLRSRQEGDTAIAVFWTAKEDQVANKGRGNTFQ